MNKYYVCTIAELENCGCDVFEDVDSSRVDVVLPDGMTIAMCSWDKTDIDNAVYLHADTTDIEHEVCKDLLDDLGVVFKLIEV